MYAYGMDKHSGPPEASQLTKTERAYLAGIIDGEGSIGIYARRKGGSNYFLKLAVTNTEFSLIKWLDERLGGATVYKQNKSPKHKPTWTLSIYQQNALRVIKLAKPFMVVKIRQAELAERFISEFKDNRGAGNGRSVPAAEVASRKRFAEQMALLNHSQSVVAAAETKRRGTTNQIVVM